MQQGLSLERAIAAGRSALQLGLRDQARELFERVLQVEPGHPEARLGLDLVEVPQVRPRTSEIALVWRHGPGLPECWEADWLRFVLSGQRIVDLNPAASESVAGHRAWPTTGPALIVDQRLTREKLGDYRALYRAGVRFGLVHLSDELYADDRAAYAYASLVLRNYWSAELQHDRRVLTLPLGWKSGFVLGGANLPAHQRKYSWCFVGSSRKTQRERMLGALSQISGGFLHLISSFDGPGSLPTLEYQDVLSQSVFCPAPAGHANLDSFRVWEALECGSIPIVERRPGFDYFRLAYGEHPLPTLQDWSEVPAIMRPLLADPAAMESLRLSCGAWWQSHKQELRRRVAALIQERLAG